MKTIDKIITVAEKQGWNVMVCNGENNTVNLEFSQFSPYGQDFYFSICGKENKPEMLIENIKEYYEGFDPDYEAYLWIGEDGHGKRGAPYHIKTIVEDMEAMEEMIYQLYINLTDVIINIIM